MENLAIFSHLITIPVDVSICGLVFGIPLTVSALFGNILIVLTVFKEKRLQQRQNVFVASMALSELAMVVTRDIFFLVAYGTQRWSLGGRFAVMLHMTRTFRNVSAVGHIVAITVYRYALIVHNKAYHTIAKIPCIVAVLLFLYIFPIISGLASVSEIFKGTDVETFMTINTKSMSSTKFTTLLSRQAVSNSSTNGSGGEVSNGPNVLMLVILYLVANILILAGCYIHIYIFVRRSKKRLQSWGKNKENPGAQNGDKHKDNTEIKFIKTMAIVFVAFVCSYVWLPIVAAVDSPGRLSHWIYFPFVIMNWAASSINWVVYGLTHPTFREGFKKILGCGRTSRNNAVNCSSVAATQDTSVTAIQHISSSV